MNHADVDIDATLADLALANTGSGLSALTESQRDASSALIPEILTPHPTLWQFTIDSSMRVVDSRAPTLCTCSFSVNTSEHGVSVGHPALDVQIRGLVVSAFEGRSGQALLESARGSGCRLMVVARNVGVKVRLELLDLDSELRFPDELLTDLFSLTQTESVIVKALLCGQTLREYAENNGVSRNTVRTHLKSVFMKTRTHRQADLVKLVQLVCMSYSHHNDAL